MNLRMLLAGLIVAAASALGADIDGKWAGSANGRELGYTFVADGTTLNGTMMAPDGGGEFKIAKGKIEGNKVSFLVTIDFGGMTIDLSFSGEIAGTTMNLTGDFNGMPFEIVLKKA